MQDIQKRLNRVIGQLEALRTTIASEATCDAVVPQLLATKGALDAIVTRYLESAIEQCVQTREVEELQKLMKTVVKHV